MSANTKVSARDHATHTAHMWVNDVAKDTDDREFAYRVLRAWLHTLRDRLTIEASAHFAAQLPDLLRGVVYGGWNPSAFPEKYDVEASTTPDNKSRSGTTVNPRDEDVERTGRRIHLEPFA